MSDYNEEDDVTSDKFIDYDDRYPGFRYDFTEEELDDFNNCPVGMEDEDEPEEIPDQDDDDWW